MALHMVRKAKEGASRLRLSPHYATRGWTALRAIRGVLRRPRPHAVKTTAVAAPKPPPPLPRAFMLSHLENDGPVRLDRVKLGVCEVPYFRRR